MGGSGSDEWAGFKVETDEDMPPGEIEPAHPDEPREGVSRRAWDRVRRLRVHAVPDEEAR